ncbi:MAG: lysine exporter LysO family protein [Firmicutes bacterium]|nr:lysine exporter LysO family protein [Bacillota bacterium]
MGYVVLYMSVLAIGYFLGSKLRDKREKMGFLDGLTNFCVSLLVFVMGIKMGSNEEVIANLGTIGIQSVVITVVLGVITVAGVTAARLALGMNKYALTKAQQAELGEMGIGGNSESGAAEEEGGGSNLMTILILAFTVIGLIAGYFVVRNNAGLMAAFDASNGHIMTVGLCLLMLSIGLGMGLDGTVLTYLKQAGFRVLVFPVVVILATTVGGFVISLIYSDLSVGESLAICYGFGWYTFAPIAISNAGYVMAGAISFLHNVIRELAGIVLMPILAKRIGYLEVAAIPGVAAMDVCLPIVERVTRQDIIIYSFLIGFSQAIFVPVLVNMALAFA